MKAQDACDGSDDSHQCARGDNRHRTDEQRFAGQALDKRDLVGADDVDDERLGEQRFHEPAGVKQRWVVPALEHDQHDEEGHVVKDGADGPDDHDEAPQVAKFPLPWLGKPFFVDCVCRDGGVAQIVQEVVGQ